MSINGSGISEIIIIPHRIQDLFSGKSDSLILQEISQKLKFLEAQIHRFIIYRCLMRLVNDNPTC